MDYVPLNPRKGRVYHSLGHPTPVALSSWHKHGVQGRTSSHGCPPRWEVQRVLYFEPSSRTAVVLVEESSDTSRELLAVKVSQVASTVRRRQTKSLALEILLLGMVGQQDHRFIVPFRGAFQTATHTCLSFPFFEFGDLYAQLQLQGPLTEEATRHILACLVLALDYLHSKGVVHRDIKPENILVRPDGHVCITDFSAAERVKPGHTLPLYSVCGTGEYVAPEVYSDNGYGKDVDWWSLGVLTYELLFGHTPFKFDVEEPLATYAQELKFSSELSAECTDLVTQLLCVHPKNRLGSVAGASEVKNHAFFQGFPWEAMAEGEVSSSFVPVALRPDCDSKDQSQAVRRPEEQGLVRVLNADLSHRVPVGVPALVVQTQTDSTALRAVEQQLFANSVLAEAAGGAWRSARSRSSVGCWAGLWSALTQRCAWVSQSCSGSVCCTGHRSLSFPPRVVRVALVDAAALLGPMRPAGGSVLAACAACTFHRLLKGFHVYGYTSCAQSHVCSCDNPYADFSYQPPRSRCQEAVVYQFGLSWPTADGRVLQGTVAMEIRTLTDPHQIGQFATSGWDSVALCYPSSWSGKSIGAALGQLQALLGVPRSNRCADRSAGIVQLSIRSAVHAPTAKPHTEESPTTSGGSISRYPRCQLSLLRSRCGDKDELMDSHVLQALAWVGAQCVRRLLLCACRFSPEMTEDAAVSLWVAQLRQAACTVAL